MTTILCILISQVVSFLAVFALALFGKLHITCGFKYGLLVTFYQGLNPNANFVPVHRRTPWFVKEEKRS